MAITRRAFMKGGAIAVVGTAAIPSFLVFPGANLQNNHFLNILKV
jgi:hypothetical protein